MVQLNAGNLISTMDLSRMRNQMSPLFPFVSYGLGVMRIRVPGLLLGGTKSPELYGHLGATGSFAFWEKKTNSYFAGTVNQLGDPGLGSKFLLELVAKTLKFH